jgi:hypothetical protein
MIHRFPDSIRILCFFGWALSHSGIASNDYSVIPDTLMDQAECPSTVPLLALTDIVIRLLNCHCSTVQFSQPLITSTGRRFCSLAHADNGPVILQPTCHSVISKNKWSEDEASLTVPILCSVLSTVWGRVCIYMPRFDSCPNCRNVGHVNVPLYQGRIKGFVGPRNFQS